MTGYGRVDCFIKYRYKFEPVCLMKRRESASSATHYKNVETTKVFTPNFSDSTSYCKVSKEHAIPSIEHVAIENELIAH